MSDPAPLVAELEFVLLGPGLPAIRIEPPAPGVPAPHEVRIEVRGMSVEHVGEYLGFLSRCIADGLTTMTAPEPVEDASL